MRPSHCLGLFFGALLASTSVRPAGAAESATGNPPEASSHESTSHLAELFYLNTDLGVQYVGLQQLHVSKDLFPSTVHTVGVGPAVGVGAGVRLVFVTLGPRFRYGSFRDWDLWSLDGEAGLRVPLGPIEPWVVLGAGYVKLGRLQERNVRVHGYDIRLGFGLDYYFNQMFSLGGGIAGEVLGMTRPGVDLNASTGTVAGDVYQLDGATVGLALMASVSVGLHL